MKKVFSLFSVLLLILSFSLAFPRTASAAYEDCSSVAGGEVKITSGKLGDGVLYKEGQISSMDLTLDVSKLQTGTYKAWIYDSNDAIADIVDGMSSMNTVGSSNEFEVTTTSKTASLSLSGNFAFKSSLVNQAFETDYKYIHLFRKRSTGNYTSPSYCYLGFYGVKNPTATCSQPLKISQLRDTDEDPKTPALTCYANNKLSCVDNSSNLIFETDNILDSNGSLYSGTLKMSLGSSYVPIPISVTAGKLYTEMKLGPGNYSVSLRDINGPCTAELSVSSRCQKNSSCSQSEPLSPGSTATGDYKRFELCNQIADSTMKQQCMSCMDGTNSSSKKAGVWTAIGCVGQDPESITQKLIQLGVGMGGGLCLLMCLAGGFILTTSEGNPKKVEEARGMITGAIVGLLFVLFSVVILQFIGVTIFQIPAFGTAPK